jgi:hypothetical protein
MNIRRWVIPIISFLSHNFYQTRTHKQQRIQVSRLDQKYISA